VIGDSPELNFSSYAFNAGNAVFTKRQFAGMFPGVMGEQTERD